MFMFWFFDEARFGLQPIAFHCSTLISGPNRPNLGWQKTFFAIFLIPFSQNSFWNFQRNIGIIKNTHRYLNIAICFYCFLVLFFPCGKYPSADGAPRRLLIDFSSCLPLFLQAAACQRSFASSIFLECGTRAKCYYLNCQEQAFHRTTISLPHSIAHHAQAKDWPQSCHTIVFCWSSRFVWWRFWQRQWLAVDGILPKVRYCSKTEANVDEDKFSKTAWFL